MRVAAEPLTRMPQQQSDILPTLKAEQAVIDARNAEYAKRSAELLDESFVWSSSIKSLVAALVGLLVVMLCWSLARPRQDEA